MTYDSLILDLQSVSEFFISVFTRLIVTVNSYPLLVLGVIVSICFPALYFVFTFISDIADSFDDVTSEGFQVYRSIKKMKIRKEIKENRKQFHNNKNYSRNYGSYYSRSYRPYYSQSTTTTRGPSANIDVVRDD